MAMYTDKSQILGRRGERIPAEVHDVQIDKETGLPVRIVPDGEKRNDGGTVPPSERLRIDPQSRIPRPVQPDLA